VRISEAYGELLALTNAAVFRAPRSSRPNADPPRQNSSERNLALIGEEFHESNVNWKVVHVGWSNEDKAAGMRYFDMSMAEAGLWKRPRCGRSQELLRKLPEAAALSPLGFRL